MIWRYLLTPGLANGYDLVTSDFLIVDGEDLYVISSVATDEVLEDMYHYVEQMVLSFVIL